MMVHHPCTTGDLARAADSAARICRLPGVPTADWCARAASAFAPSEHRTSLTVAVAAIGAEGELVVESAHSVIGAARSRAVEDDDLEALTRRLNSVFAAVSPNKRPGVHSGLIESSAIDAGPPGAGAIHALAQLEEIGTKLHDAWLVVETVLKDATEAAVERESALLGALLPHIASRCRLAFARAPSGSGGLVTPSEQLILEQLVLGHTVRQIAETLERSPHTIQEHVKNLHRKFGASSRGQLIARALGHVRTKV